MNKSHHDYEVISYPKLRRVLEIMYPSVQRKPMILGLLEVDVTEARQFLREQKAKTGESLSFTAFIIACMAHAIAENPSLNTCRKGNNRLAIFHEVDVATAIERDMSGQKQPIIYIIRAANTKSFRDIHHEIRSAQIAQVKQAWAGSAAMNWLRFLPFVFIRIGWWAFCWTRRTYPQAQKKYGGTVGVTAIGMFGKGGGWGIPLNDHTLDLTLGGIARKPGVVDGQIALREYLCLTVSVNHALIDGAPAVRFVQRLKELIESGYGLHESEAEEPVPVR